MKKRFEEEIYFTPRQAAEYFNLGLSTIKNYIYAGKLKTLRTPGGHHRVCKSELLSTLGHEVMASESMDRAGLKANLCTAILTVFKTFGPAGNRLIIHAKNVSELSTRIARAMGMKGDEIKYIERAAFLHDIGHIGIEKQVVLKSGPLTKEEYNLVKNHPEQGEDMLNSVEELRDIADIVVQHHEWINGRGYPKGLRGKKIHNAACIISIAEAYDAMVSEYSYKEPITKDMAIAELIKYRGIQFDGDMVEVFVNL